MRYFEHEVPIDPSSMSCWRGAGKASVEELLQQTIRAALRLKVITPNQLERINITCLQKSKLRGACVKTFQSAQDVKIGSTWRNGKSHHHGDLDISKEFGPRFQALRLLIADSSNPNMP